MWSVAPAMQSEVFYCERFRALAGWSADYMMPTDKHPYRVRGAAQAWATIDQADNALLAPGWSWDEPRSDIEEGSEEAQLYVGGRWLIDPTGQTVDKDNWCYSTGFTGNYSGQNRRVSQAILMGVRWRRMVRRQKFEGTSASLAAEAAANAGGRAPEDRYCPYYDIERAALVGRQIMEAMSAASLQGEWSDHALVKLKQDMLRHLTTSLAAEGQESGTPEERFEASLAQYINSYKDWTAKLVEGFAGTDDNNPEVTTRLEKLIEKFPEQEREAYAVLAMHRFQLLWGCPASAENPHAGECELRPVFCPHEGCTERCSAKDLPQHDTNCQRKPAKCDLCGNQVPLGDLGEHKRHACVERYVPCTYKCLGCEAYVKVYDLEKHMASNREAHITMMAKTCVSQQQLIEEFAAKLEELEEVASQQFEAIAWENHSLAQLKERAAALEAKEAVAEGRTDAEAKRILNDAWWESRRASNAVYYETENQVKYIQRDLAKHGVADLVKEVAQLNMKTSLANRR